MIIFVFNCWGGPQLEELKEYVKNDHIESYVIFTGPQSGEMVPAHYHISIYVYFSIFI